MRAIPRLIHICTGGQATHALQLRQHRQENLAWAGPLGRAIHIHPPRRFSLRQPIGIGLTADRRLIHKFIRRAARATPFGQNIGWRHLHRIARQIFARVHPIGAINAKAPRIHLGQRHPLHPHTLGPVRRLKLRQRHRRWVERVIDRVAIA